MNVYDFDDTILHGDSTARFTVFCFTHYPKLWLDIPGQAVNAILFVLHIRPKQKFKERLLSLVTFIGDTDAAVERFWGKNFCRIKKYYLTRHKDDDVVISASPEFLIRPACEKLGIRVVMGSPVDPRTGHFMGLNCHDTEKVRRFREVFGNAQIDEFYSDSHSDDPLAKLATKAFMVKGEKITEWEFK